MKRICAGFFFYIICLYVYCHWRSRGECRNPIDRFNSATLLCLSLSST